MYLIFNKFSKILGIVIFVVISFVLIKGILTPQEIKFDRYLESIKKKEYRGIVLRKYRDRSRHNRSFLVFASNKEVSIKSKVYDEIELKDSIIKKEGELYLTIYRNNNKLIIGLD